MNKIILSSVVFFVITFSFNIYSYDKVTEVNNLFQNFNNFQTINKECELELEKDAVYISINFKKLRVRPFVFILPNSIFDERHIKSKQEQINECKLENQVISCLHEEAGQMPEHNTQSYQHMELKLDKDGNIVDMHVYKIQKRFLFNTELKMFEKKYAEFYCPSRETLTNDKSVNNSTGVKEKTNVAVPLNEDGKSSVMK